MSHQPPGVLLRIASAAAAVGMWLAAAATAAAQVPAPASPGPLSKAHSALEGTANCQKCHRPGSGIDSAKCLACHKPIADRIAGKRGVHREVTGQCEGCHVEHAGVDVDLRPLDTAQFNHAEETGFALVGRHQAVAKTCASCHKTRSFLNNNPACVSCHQDGHKGALGTACSTCHTPTAWRSASRAFHKVTLFPLEGRHLTVACASCHLNGVTKGTPTKCFDCHWIRRRDDPYETRLGNQCEMCHRPISWTAVNWNHAARTGYALNASHRPLTCGACHKDRRFTGTGFTCANCHLDEYSRTVRPNHAAAGFPTACEACHSPGHTSWNQAMFNHATYPLVGRHAAQDCVRCHKNGVYKGTPRDCVGCHLADYQRTTNPNHAAAGFPTTCDACHKASDPSWKGSVFSHTAYPLVGQHTAQPCAACHKNGVYKGTPRECVGCHLANYQKTTSPGHTAAGFPTTCDVCHRATDSTWNQGRFVHTAFPITSGRHAGLTCSTCHTTPTNYKVFSCLTGCHPRSDTDSEHSGRAGYRYDSAACYSCHPTGRATRPRPVS